jgi:hypothetical protein
MIIKKYWEKKMENNKLIANLLLEIAKNSTTEFIEDSKVDSEIKESAKKMGMILPSPDLAVFKTKWADIDKKNLNNVRLPRKAVEDGIQTLVGKNLNFEHKGAYNVCGFCLSVKIKKDEIECIQVFYKSLYPEQFEELKEKIKTKEAAVSFEIWNKSPETGESVVKELSDGTKEIIKIICHGTGLLLCNPPACPTAKIFHLEAKKELENAEKIVDKIFSEDLIYAQMAIEEPKCKNCGKCNCGKEVKIIIKQIESKEWICPYCEKEIGEKELFLDEKTNKWYHRPCQEKGEIILPKETVKDKEEKIMIKCEKCGKEFESSAEEKICVECASLPKEEPKTQLPEEPKTEVKPDETKPVDAGVETKPEETKVEVTPEVKAQEVQVIEPKIIVKTTSIYSEVRIDTYIDGTPSGTQEVKGYTKTITEYKDGTKDEVETQCEIKKKFDFAEVEEKVNAAKAEKDAEIATLKTEHERILAEKDKEITTIKQELGKKDQEIAELKNPKVEEKKEPEMTVGAVTVKDNYKAIQEEVNEKAFGKKK